MRTPMTIVDFLDRAELGFRDSPGVVDEPHQLAPPVPVSTYGRFAERVRAWQAGLDALGVGEGSGWRWSATTPPACWSCCSRCR